MTQGTDFKDRPFNALPPGYRERPSVRIGPAVGQVWEGRQRRRDGTRERVRIVAIDGRKALIESENPRPPLKSRRTIGLLLNELTGTASLGNMRLAEVDGRRVSWAPGGAVAHG